MRKIRKFVLVVLMVMLTSIKVFASNSDVAAVKGALTTAFDIIKNVDIDKIKKDYSDEQTKGYIAAVETFMTDYPESKGMLKTILGEIDYDIRDVESYDERMTVHIDFTAPDFEKVISKVMPKIIINNVFTLFSEKLSEKNIYYIIECIYDELVKEKSDEGSYKKVKFTYDFKFKKENGTWIISNFEDIEEELMGLLRIK